MSKRSTTTVERKYLIAGITTYFTGNKVSHCEVEINEKDTSVLSWQFRVFDNPSDIEPWLDGLEKRIEINKLCREYITEMEGYSYYGSNPGIPEDCIEEMVDDIFCKILNKWG